MNKRVFFGQNDIRYLYLRYKDSKYYAISVFSLVIVVCIVLLLRVVMPNIGNYMSIRQEAANQREKIRIINENISAISALDKPTLTTQLEVATKALPSEKDFSGILDAVAYSAIHSGVNVSDFSFNVGKIASKSAQPSGPPSQVEPVSQALGTSKADASSTIDLTIVINGSIDRTRNFLKELGEILPLSEVSSLDTNENSTTIAIKFYYSPYPEITYKEDVSINLLSDQKRDLVNKLGVWSDKSSTEQFIAPVGTGSATPLFE